MNVVKRLRARPVVIGLALIVVAVLFSQTADAQYLYIGDSALVAAIGALGLNVLTGSAGQVSIGNAAFIGLGAYTAVLLDDDVPFLLVILIGGVVSAVVGLAIGIPSLRLRGLYLVFSTLALQFTASYVFIEYDSSSGAISGHEIAVPHIGSFAITTDLQWFVFLLIALAVVALVVHFVLRGRPGRAWDAIRANEASASIMGIDVRRTKLNAFVLSSFIVGMCGAITAYFVQNVSGDYFTLDMAVSYVAMILIGGLGSIGGAIAGAVVVTALPTLTTTIGTDLLGAGSSTGFIQKNLSAIDSGVYGLLILVFMFSEPQGLAGIARRLEALAGRLLGAATSRRTGTSPPGPLPDDAGEPDAGGPGNPSPAANGAVKSLTRTELTVGQEDRP